MQTLIPCPCGQSFPFDRVACPYCAVAPEIVWYWDADAGTPRRAAIINRKRQQVVVEGNDGPSLAPAALRDLFEPPRPDLPPFLIAVARDLRRNAPRLLIMSILFAVIAATEVYWRDQPEWFLVWDVLPWAKTILGAVLMLDVGMSLVLGIAVAARRLSAFVERIAK